MRLKHADAPLHAPFGKVAQWVEPVSGRSWQVSPVPHPIQDRKHFCMDGGSSPPLSTMRFERPTKPVKCTCYKCTSPVYQWDQETATKRIYNNVHGHLQACEWCGRPKSEYVDNYTKGHYECWWCTERAAGPFGPEPAPPTGAL